MVFYITLGSEYEPGRIALLALENLAQSAANGDQLVSADRALLETLAGDSRLSDRARSYYRRMAQSVTQLGGLIEQFDRINIRLENEDLTETGGVVPIGVFSNASFCEKTQLLVENLTDYEVLSGLARIFLSERYHGLQLSFRAQNGGGSTTPQVLEHLMTNASGPVLCVVDSDRKFLGAGLGDTARTTQRQARRAPQKWRLTFHVLSVRELENLVPTDLRRQCTADLCADVQDALIRFEMVPNVYADFCCLKAGDSRCRMLGDALSKKQYGHMETLGRLPVAGQHVIPRCGTCPYDGGCFSSPPLGQGFLQRVAEVLRSGVGITTASDWRTDLQELVRTVLQAGLAVAPQRI